MGILPKDIARAVAGGNKVLQQLKQVCPKPGEHRAASDILASAYQSQAEEYRHIIESLKPKKRIRQNSKPLSNKLESEFGIKLRLDYPESDIFEQAITLRIANGLRYTPDWAACHASCTTFYEVKGRHAWDDSIAKLKMAATTFPMWHWFLVWKCGERWELQRVFP